MQRPNTIEFEITGRSAMFTDPEVRTKSLPVPTYEAIKGILREIYWKPTFIWVVDEVRVMNCIMPEKYSLMKMRRPVVREQLQDVRYQVRAHFVWNENRPEFAADRDEDKHFRIALRCLAKGGRFAAYLGTADCPCTVKSVRFGSGESYYDHSGKIDLGTMYHGVTYPDEGWDSTTRSGICMRTWHCVMNDGVLRYTPPELCASELVKYAAAKCFNTDDTEVDTCAAGTKN